MLITFSGLDGSGKSTLVEYLKESLERENKKVVVSHMNYDVGFYSLLRFVGAKLTKTNGRAAQTHVPRDRAFENDFQTKGAKLRYKLVWNKGLRFLIYPLDVLIFRFYRLYVESMNQRVLIMDRYFYDTVVDLTGARRTFQTRLLSWLTPTPDLSIYLDCNAERAFRRKHEYSVDFLNRRRLSYQKLVAGLPRMVVISTDQDLDATRLTLAGAVRESMSS
ncbi:MAG: dTMP kinase [Acidobacteriota bacterium]